MKCAIAALAVPGIVVASSPERKLPAAATVMVCVEKAAAVQQDLLDRAELTAGRMFGSIGLKIEWSNRGRSCLQELQPIVLSVTTDTPRHYLPRAYGMALPYEGYHIRMFYDRIQPMRPDEIVPLMAHVLAHEIVHVISGTDYHSETGVMKFRWSSADLEQMVVRPLPFSDLDILLLKIGIRSRHARLATMRNENTPSTMSIPSE